ncbi:hypothetical protein GCK72_000990 [Caenorhabditis remanei]|uniref:Protein kinase domain-containing protein n=1 Tax=Caenorhabditis remanei TaxID=31234 RepID=A0A6A5HR67_CAERE|nr:hypothetical protein GCK72_000990 [Caenorhabditis remanei]KAF1769176.1 hypothetical protein GCK72_000990 [Caenorhabditis remanei]
MNTIDVTKISGGTKFDGYTVDHLIGSFKDDIEYLVKGKDNKNEDKDYMVFKNYQNDLRDMYKGRVISTGEIKNVMQQLIKGLNHLDLAGIIHRDIQPKNLKIEHDGNFDNFILKIANFGSAVKYKTRIVDHHRVALQYRSIELLLCTETPKQASDRWSAGCVMAELLKGAPLFDASHQLEMIHKVFTFLGKPDKVWPEYNNLTMKSYICLDGYNYMEKPDFEKEIPLAPKVEVGILRKLLAYAPDNRDRFNEEERNYLLN